MHAKSRGFCFEETFFSFLTFLCFILLFICTVSEKARHSWTCIHVRPIHLSQNNLLWLESGSKTENPVLIVRLVKLPAHPNGFFLFSIHPSPTTSGLIAKGLTYSSTSFSLTVRLRESSSRLTYAKGSQGQSFSVLMASLIKRDAGPNGLWPQK